MKPIGNNIWEGEGSPEGRLRATLRAIYKDTVSRVLYMKLADHGGANGWDVISGVEAASQAPPATPLVSISVNSTQTGDPGTEAKVTNSGTPTSVQLDFVIPRGLPGEDGVSPTISIHSVETLDPGEPATVTNEGTETDVQLKFGIPKGQPGSGGGGGMSFLEVQVFS